MTLPVDVNPTGYGAIVVAMVAVLSGLYRHSQRMVQTAMQDLFRLSRCSEAARCLLGEDFGAILTSDRHGAYNWVDLQRRQLCWAHVTLLH